MIYIGEALEWIIKHGVNRERERKIADVENEGEIEKGRVNI